MHLFKAMIVLALVGATIAATTFAQDGSSIGGTVRDRSGAVIVGAAIKCAGTVGRPIAISDENGSFKFPAELCVHGQIEVSATGFSSNVAEVTSDLDAPMSIVLDPAPLTANLTIFGKDALHVDTAVSLVTIDQSDLDMSGSLTLDDRLRQLPGFSLFRRSGSRTANPTAQGVSLRGVGASGSSRALVLADSIPLNDPFGGWVYWGRVPSESIAEVNILRGTAGDIYGNAAVGGVVSIISREPSVPIQGSIDTSYGTERSPFFSGFSTAGWGKLSGSLATEMFSTHGFIPVERASRGPVDTAAGVDRLSLRPSIEWRRSSGLRLFAAGEMYREVRRNGSALQTNDTMIRGLSAGADTTMAHVGSVTLRAYFSEENYHQSFSAISADRRVEALNRLQRVPSQMRGLSAQWIGESWSRNVVFAGFDLRSISGRSDETGIQRWTATSLSSTGGREFSGGAYFGLAINSIPRTVISGGLRTDGWHESGGYSSTLSLVNGAATTTSFPARRAQALSPRASVLYRVAGGLSLAATYGRSFRQPTLNELYRSFRVGNVITLANPSLDAEIGQNLEASAIVNGFAQRLNARGGFFCTTIDNAASNLTLSVTPSLITRMRQSVGRIRSCGFEGDLQAKTIAGLTFRLNYQHANSRVVKQPGSPSLEGRFLPQVPADQGSFQVVLSRLRSVTLSFQLRASARQFDDDQNLLPLAGFVAGDAFAAFRINSRLLIYAAAENLTNVRTEAGRTPVTTIGQERNARVGIRWNFGKR